MGEKVISILVKEASLNRDTSEDDYIFCCEEMSFLSKKVKKALIRYLQREVK